MRSFLLRASTVLPLIPVCYFALMVHCAPAAGSGDEQKQSKPSKAVVSSSPAENRARPYKEGMKAFEKYTKSEGCEGPDREKILVCLKDLKEDVNNFNIVGMRAYESEQRTRHTSLAFSFADEALKRGCLKDADEIYRDLIRFYVGETYAGIRDRAKLGVDDVREERRAKREQSSDN